MMIFNHCFKIPSLIPTVALITGLGLVNPVNAQVHSYLIDLNSKTATDLGSLGGDYTYAEGLNDAGQVVGESWTANSNLHAFITGPNGVGMRDLGIGKAYAINAAGQVVGGSGGHIFITGPDGIGMRNLGTLGGSYSDAYSINDAGQVVGFSDTAEGAAHAFITGPNGVGTRDLGTLGGDNSIAYGINDAGQVVGDSGGHAFITGPDGMGMRKALEDDLSCGNFCVTEANGINNSGQVVGRSLFVYRNPHSFVFIIGPNDDGRESAITSMTSGSQADAHSINNAGQVAGGFLTAGHFHAFISGPNGGGVTDLNSLVSLPAGVILDKAMAINDRGQVLATATIIPIIIPIPEPETYALMLAGLALVGFVVGRKKEESVVKRD